MSHEDKQSKFIRRITRPGTGYTGFVLVQCLSSRGESLLRKFDFDSDSSSYTEETLRELAAEVLVSAQDDADGHLGLSSYCLYGLKGTNKVERGPVFRLRSQNGDEGELEDTESATPAGLQAQLMRHLEAQARTAIQKDEIYARSTTEIIRGLSERLKHYEEAHWETVLRAEELANEKEARELNRLKEISKDRRIDEALKTVKPLIPLLLSKFNGAKGVKPELQMEAFKEVVAQISPEQMEQIANILGPKSLALAEIYMDTHKEQSENGESESGESNPH